MIVKFSELQQYGVDRVFLLENANVDSSQSNVVFLVRGEKAHHVRTVAGKPVSLCSCCVGESVGTSPKSIQKWEWAKRWPHMLRGTSGSLCAAVAIPHIKLKLIYLALGSVFDYLCASPKCHQCGLTVSSPEQIKRLQNNGNVEHEFSIFFSPRRTLVGNAVLEEAGIVGDVNIAEFPLQFLPLEQDILSLELDDAFGDLYLVRHSF